jgi:hypothetical protein
VFFSFVVGILNIYTSFIESELTLKVVYWSEWGE